MRGQVFKKNGACFLTLANEDAPSPLIEFLRSHSDCLVIEGAFVNGSLILDQWQSISIADWVENRMRKSSQITLCILSDTLPEVLWAARVKLIN